MVLSAHILEICKQLCDKIFIMHGGRITKSLVVVDEDDVEQVYQQALLELGFR